jgi:hypothetical protein
MTAMRGGDASRIETAHRVGHLASAGHGRAGRSPEAVA